MLLFIISNIIAIISIVAVVVVVVVSAAATATATATATTTTTTTIIIIFIEDINFVEFWIRSHLTSLSETNNYYFSGGVLQPVT